MGRAMLLMVSGLFIVSGLIQMANNNRVNVMPEITAENFDEQQAKNINASLVDNAIRNLRRNNNWQNDISSDQYMEGSGSLKTYVMGDTVISDANWEWSQWKVLLVSRASYGNHKVKSEVLLHRDSFSRFSYFTNAETLPDGGPIWFGGNDVITGPVHTNGTFRIMDSPTFDGLVTSPNMWIPNDGSTNPQFLGGTNFNSSTRDLPDAEQIDVLKNAANSTGLTFEDDASLEFFVNEEEGVNGEGYVKKLETYEYDCSCRYSSGYYTCEERNYGYDICTGISGSTDYKLSDYGGLISIDGNLNIRGTVKGKVTVHTSNDMNITGDIEYYVNPNPDAEPEDDDYYLGLLGLVSEGNIIVDRDAHTYKGYNDVTIHASIMALGTSFTVEDYDNRVNRGTLNVLGGIIQSRRGPVGLTNGSGYSKNYVYDQRLRSQVPPEFPRESKFTIVYWRDYPAEEK